MRCVSAYVHAIAFECMHASTVHTVCTYIMSMEFVCMQCVLFGYGPPGP